jgi:agmatinase
MHEFPFLTRAGFLGCEIGSALRPFAVAGVAWDGATTNRPGARFGPQAIRAASHMLCDAHHPVWDCAPSSALCDLGDLLVPNTSLLAMRAALEISAAPLVATHHMCWLGGDHSITLALLRVYRRLYGRPLALVHFDAHCDTWVDHYGEPSGHGTWVYEAIEEGLVEPSAIVQIGIRSPGSRSAREYVRTRGGTIFEARELRGLDGRVALAHVVDAVRRCLLAAGSPPLYLSLDIDCLDPAFAPGTGTPEPAGLSTSQVATLLEELAGLPFAGMDCVEVAPAYDHAQLTSHAAAFFVWSYLCARIASGDSAIRA